MKPLSEKKTKQKCAHYRPKDGAQVNLSCLRKVPFLPPGGGPACRTKLAGLSTHHGNRGLKDILFPPARTKAAAAPCEPGSASKNTDHQSKARERELNAKNMPCGQPETSSVRLFWRSQGGGLDIGMPKIPLHPQRAESSQNKALQHNIPVGAHRELGQPRVGISRSFKNPRSGRIGPPK